ncbi:hypothetical protein PR001_g14473 [Phytophthora rubi]|uniref:Uncharacterized protein n=1 Tax=Phytophthora rubi TaxID=129364 RepID=A0A6A3KVG7_9STRA|nr:hypothetical protein PR002_g15121 [Phytophthora rubi]KAE9017157.1 hypothetical protein PR001_g14473 [Phytophthora rubi]
MVITAASHPCGTILCCRDAKFAATVKAGGGGGRAARPAALCVPSGTMSNHTIPQGLANALTGIDY